MTTPSVLSNPAHPQHSVWAGIKAALAHIVGFLPQAEPYVEEALKVGVAAGIHVSPQAAAIATGVEAAAAIVSEVEKEKAQQPPADSAPAEPTPSTPAEPAPGN